MSNYAKPGDRILDTHAGSAASLVACWNMGFEFAGFEIDPDYYKKASERLAVEMAQIRLWDYIDPNQTNLFETEESE